MQEDCTSSHDGGVLKEMLVKGSGSCLDGDEVVVHYVGTLQQDGTQFDSSRDRGEPFKFKLGAKSVIEGWEIAVKTMCVGEKSKFTIKANYGYGEKGSGNIPANATLVFEIELLEVRGEDISEETDGSLRKRILKKADEKEFCKPSEDSLVVVSGLLGKQDDRTFDDRYNEKLKFSLLVSDDSSLPYAVELAIKSMARGERAIIEFDGCENADYLEGIVDSSIKKGRISYEITLESFEEPKSPYDMSDEEKIEEARRRKEFGNSLYRKNLFRSAMKRYASVTDFSMNVPGLGKSGENKSMNKIINQANLNLANCHYRLGEWRKAIDKCDAVLEKESNNQKALFRKAESELAALELEEAYEHYQNLLKLNPSSALIRQKLNETKRQMADIVAQRNSLYMRMFKGVISNKQNKEEEENDTAATEKIRDGAEGDCQQDAH